MVNPWSTYNMQDPGGDNPPNDPSGGGVGPDEQKKQCHDSGGVWVGTGPYGQGYCQQGGTNTDCPDGQTYVSSVQGCRPKCGPTQAHDINGNCVEVGNDPGPQEPNKGGGSSTTTYKPPSYTPTKSPYDDAMSKQLFDTLTNMINGGDAPFGPDTIAKMQAAALSSNKGQLANSRTNLERRLVASGLTRTGAAPQAQANLENAAAADLSNNLRTVAVTAVQQNYNARVTALNQAQQFLQSERANALSQDQLILAYARLNQEWKTTQAGFDQQWKLVQNGDEQSLMKLMLCLRTNPSGACF